VAAALSSRSRPVDLRCAGGEAVADYALRAVMLRRVLVVAGAG
jgi:hypothetical protein